MSTLTSQTQTLHTATAIAWFIATATVTTPAATLAVGIAVALTAATLIENARLDREALIAYGASVQAARCCPTTG